MQARPSLSLMVALKAKQILCVCSEEAEEGERRGERKSTGRCVHSLCGRFKVC